MILKEIQMDLPFVNNKCNDYNESKKLYENTWKLKRRQFQLMSRCMTSMIERLMPTVRTESYWKILIECVDESPRKEVINLLGVCSIQILFDSTKFFNINNFEKKQYIIETIIKAINYLCINNNIHLEEIRNVCDIIKGTNYTNEWFWKKPVKMAYKNVQIKILHEVDIVSIYMVFKDTKKGVIKEILIVQDVPDEWIYNKYLGKLEWISEDTAQLVTKDGNIICRRYI